jgi:hypothetical protein
MQQTDGYVNEMEARYLPSRAVGRGRCKGVSLIEKAV